VTGVIFGKTSEEPRRGQGRSTKEDSGYRSKLSDDELIDKIRQSKNGNKFAELMRGDIEYLKQQCGYTSASEADLALVMSLAFWTLVEGLLNRSNRRPVIPDPVNPGVDLGNHPGTSILKAVQHENHLLSLWN
jgi:hypothetical protein